MLLILVMILSDIGITFLNSSSTFDFDNYIHCLDHAIPYGCVDHDRVADGYLAVFLAILGI